jgi:hypothetical protein
MAAQFERFRFPQVKPLKYLNQFCEPRSLSPQKRNRLQGGFSGAACEIGIAQITNSGDKYVLCLGRAPTQCDQQHSQAAGEQR